MDNLASQWAAITQWLFPIVWVLLGLVAFVRQHRLAGIALTLAGVAAICFAILFAPNSSFIAGWETDAPLSVAFSYKPIGFLAANLLPAISNFGLVLACVAFLRRRG